MAPTDALSLFSVFSGQKGEKNAMCPKGMKTESPALNATIVRSLSLTLSSAGELEYHSGVSAVTPFCNITSTGTMPTSANFVMQVAMHGTPGQGQRIGPQAQSKRVARSSHGLWALLFKFPTTGKVNSIVGSIDKGFITLLLFICVTKRMASLLISSPCAFVNDQAYSANGGIFCASAPFLMSPIIVKSSPMSGTDAASPFPSAAMLAQTFLASNLAKSLG